MKTKILLLATALSAIVVSGCSNAADAIIGNRNPRVKIVNAVRDTTVNATVDNQGVATNLAFEDVAPQAIIDNGNHTITFRNTANDSIVTTRTQLFELNKDYVVVGYGPAGANNMLILSDAATPAAGNAAVRFAHAGGTPDAIDAYVIPGNQNLGAGFTPAANNLAADAASTYVGVPAGSRKVIITPATNQTEQVNVTFNLEAGKNYTFVIARNNAGLRLIQVDDTTP